MSDYRIAEITGVPRPTVQRWRHRDHPPSSAADDVTAWYPPDSRAYCYLLGCYLRRRQLRAPTAQRMDRLCVAADQRYPSIIDEVLDSMRVTFEGGHPRRRAASTGASDVLSISHRAIGVAFPQHGRGRKHLRPIVLADWQSALTHAHPAELIRGLIHSDGCRVINRFRTTLPSGHVQEYGYIRYFFSNLSSDIRRIFFEHCELLGIRATQPNPRNIAVSNRASVAILEEVVGPKT